jgi:ElaB/YqjD/DUF883 family membrane-anchored ribosome-binding protein
MSNGDDGDGERPDWTPVVEDFEERLDELEAAIDDASTGTDIEELDAKLDEFEGALADSEIPDDSPEYEQVADRIDAVREQIPPAWMADVWMFESEIATVEGRIEEASSSADLDAIASDLDEIEAEIADSEIPPDAEENDELNDQLAAAREAMPPEWMGDVWDLQGDLAEIEADLEDAELEAELDEIDSELDDVESRLAASDIPGGADEEADDDEGDEEGDDEGEEVPEEREELESRIEELRDGVAEKRGPYAEDVIEAVESAEETVTGTDWTDEGQEDVALAVEEFLDVAGSEFVDTFEAASDSPADLGAALADVREIIDETGLDADDDRESIQTLLEAAEALEDDLDAAEEWGDLSVRQTLDRKGFYDVLTPKNKKDYPPEWNAVKIYEKRYQDGENPEEAIEFILLAFEKFTSDFMEENILDSLRRIAPPEAFDLLEELAQKRNKPPIEILGRIGDERALETIHEFTEGGDVALRKITLRAIGAIGSEESTQVVANQLVADNAEIRSTAARALGLIGDTRAINPLADVLDEDDTDEVRASAAWALNQIGTERARETAAAYADDEAYIVQVEAEKAGADVEAA